MPTLDWIGKKKVVNHHLDVPFRVLEKKYIYSADNKAQESENKIIHGDNLEALKSLLPEYEGKIKCIYIDPPYNTGNEGWIYNDNVNDPRIKKWLGEVVGKESEDFTRHDKWLCMMYPRLKLLQKLLSEDGVIFISIDDNEQANLKLICDEIFGSGNFVANISWQRTYSTRNDSKGISSEVEHIVVYSKNPNWSPNKLERTEKMNSLYKSPDNDPKPWTSSSVSAPGAISHQGMVYAIQHPFTGELMYPTVGRCWSLGQEQMLENMNKWCSYELKNLHDDDKRASICGIASSEIRKNVLGIVLKESIEESKAKAEKILKRGNWPYFYFTNGGKGGIRRKTYLENMDGRMPTNFFNYEECGHTDEAKKEQISIFGGSAPFDTPKPIRLIERILQIATDKDSIILDSFAGSGTTAHAVLNMNRQDGGNRKFILIEMMDYAESITAERIKRVISGYSFTGSEEIEIYNKELTINNISEAQTYIDEAKSVISKNEKKWTKISKPKLVDNCIKVIATKEYDTKKDGLGGDFTYYELGEPLLINNLLNENVNTQTIREYIWFTETNSKFEELKSEENKYYLGNNFGAAYWFYYEKEKATTLDIDFLSTIKGKYEQYIIYADICLIPQELLQKNNIIFKKIPRDIKKF